MEFLIKLDRFEGPYTKLLELIESKKLSITEISLSEVADDYISYIKTLEDKNVLDISQFIVVASTLMLIKARSLLPGVNYTEDEEKQINDLEKKLEVYSIMISASKNIRSVFDKNPLFSKDREKYKGEKLFVPSAKTNILILSSIAHLTIKSFINPQKLVKVAVENAMRIENVIESILERVKSAKNMTLSSVASGAKTFEEKKKILIINFLALLELLKMGHVNVSQNADGGDIEISTI